MIFENPLPQEHIQILQEREGEGQEIDYKGIAIISS
jgi:hypothetical protein